MPRRRGIKGRRRIGVGKKQGSDTDEAQEAASNSNAVQVKGTYIGRNNARRWHVTKETLGFVDNTAFTSHLLNLADLQPTPQAKVTPETTEKSPDHVKTRVQDNKGAMEATGINENARLQYVEDSDYDDNESFGDDDEDDDWRPSGSRPTRVLKRPSRGRKKSGSLRQTRSRSKAAHSASDSDRGGSAQEQTDDEEEEEEEEELLVARASLPVAPATSSSTSTSSYLTSSSRAESHKPSVVRVRVCPDCSQKHASGDCPLNAPVAIVLDTTWETGSMFNRAEASLPKILKLQTVDKVHGLSIFTTERVKRYTLFGPLVGRTVTEAEISEDANLKNIWEVFGENKTYLDTSDPALSNWLRYIRPAPTRDERNVTTVSRDNFSLCFVTVQDVDAGAELLYWSEDPTVAWSKKKLEKTSCGGCNQRFEHPLYYRMHCMIFHDPNFSLTIRKYHCKVCGVAVLGKENIMKHAMEMHEGKGAYQCQYCKKFFLRLNYLEMHRTYGCRLNPQRSRPLCDLCGKKFCQPQKLKVHIRRMHSDMEDVLKEFQCKTCGKLLGSRAALQRHLKEVHNKDQNIAATCDRCGKTFQNKSNLKIHMLTHSGVKPFRCCETGCTAAFTTKQCLQFHYKKVHGYGMHNMPSIERCVAYTFESYSGGLIADFERKEKARLAMQEGNGKHSIDNNNAASGLPKSFQLTPEKLVEAALKTMDSSLSSLADNVPPCIKQEDAPLHTLDSSASEDSTIDSQLPDVAPSTPATSADLHDAATPAVMHMDSPAHHQQQQQHDVMLPPDATCSPKALNPGSPDVVAALNRQQAAAAAHRQAIQRQASLLALGLSRSMLEMRDCKPSNRNRLPDSLQHLEHSLELNRHTTTPADLVTANQYSNLALCLARQRAELMGITDPDGKGLNNSSVTSISQNGNSVGMDLGNNSADHSTLEMSLHHGTDHSLLSHQSKNSNSCNDIEMHHAASEQNLDLTRHATEHGLELRHSDHNLSVSCHGDQTLDLHRSSDQHNMIHHGNSGGLDIVHHHQHHGLDIGSSSSDHLGRHTADQMDMRRHSNHDLALSSHHPSDVSSLDLVHHHNRGLHLDLTDRTALTGMRSRSEHNLSSASARNHELDSSDPRLDLSPLRREHLLDMATRHAAELRSPLNMTEHHGYNLVTTQQHRSSDLSPAQQQRQDAATIDMSCHTTMNSPTPSRCSDLNSPLPHSDPNVDLSRQTDTPAEMSRPPSHSIDLTTGRPTPLPLDLNRPPSHGGSNRQMNAVDLGRASDLLPIETGRMVSPAGYQTYSPPMYQSAPPAHMPPPSPTIHSSYHSYPGYY